MERAAAEARPAVSKRTTAAPTSPPSRVSQHSGPRPLRWQRPKSRLSDAYAASHGSILLHLFLARRIGRFGKSLPDFIADAEEGLVGRLPLESRMRRHFVVSGDVGLDVSSKSAEAAERSHECSGDRQNASITELEDVIRLEIEPCQLLAVEEFIDGSADVLGSGVRDNDRMPRTITALSDSFTQYPTGPLTAEPFREFPRQDPPAVVIDHSVERRPCSIEQPDDGHIQGEEFRMHRVGGAEDASCSAYLQASRMFLAASAAFNIPVGSRAGAVVREVVILSVSRVSPFVPV